MYKRQVKNSLKVDSCCIANGLLGANTNILEFLTFSNLSAATKVATIVLPKDATGTVTVEIGGKNYTANVTDGVANVLIPGLRCV